MKPYPKIVQINNISKPDPKLLCEFCNQPRTNKKITIALSEGDNRIINCHSDCTTDMTEAEIISYCFPGFSYLTK